MSRQQTATVVQERPAPEGFSSWPDYWEARGMPWRTEPEVDERQQSFLAGRHAISPDIKQGRYPFKDIELTRADVEWLLATHESGGMRGPVDANDRVQHAREGLDLRGVDLRGVDLSGLPLAKLRAGLTLDEWIPLKREQRVMAVAHLEQADLSSAHLEGAILFEARLDGADLPAAHLEGANLMGAHLEGANLYEAHLEGKRSSRYKGHERPPRPLFPANLKFAFFDGATDLGRVTLGDKDHGFVSVVEAHWNGVNLAVLKWLEGSKDGLPLLPQLVMLGDEREARERTDSDGRPKSAATRLDEYAAAVRANRQLATALRGQGLNEEADRFAWRAYVLQRHVYRRQGQWGKRLFLLLLATLSGYGFRLRRVFISYALLLGVFAAAYYATGIAVGSPLSWHEALLISFTAIHGRVFLGQFGLDSALSWIAGGEAVAGIIIEGIFVAMLIQRFFSK